MPETTRDVREEIRNDMSYLRILLEQAEDSLDMDETDRLADRLGEVCVAAEIMRDLAREWRDAEK